MQIYGINPVLEALRAGRVTAVRIAQRADGRLAALLEIAATSGVSVRRVAPGDLDRAAQGGVHQGVVADLRGGVQSLLNVSLFQNPAFSICRIGPDAGQAVRLKLKPNRERIGLSLV